MSRNARAAALAVALLVALTAGTTTAHGAPAPGAGGDRVAPVLVDDDPVDYTPNIVTGQHVSSLLVVGDTVYMGGLFTQLADAQQTATYDRQNLAAYSAVDGTVSPFHVDVDNDVYALAASPDGQFLYVGGGFTHLNGQPAHFLEKVSTVTGEVDPDFVWTGGIVKDLELSQGTLYVAGRFSEALLAVDPDTGADTGLVDVSITESLSGDAVKVDKIAISPNGSQLVALGDFSKVDGVWRKSAFRLLLGAPAVVIGWHPQRFSLACKPGVPFYLRDVAWSPNGRYFAIVSSGGPEGGYPATGFCDAIGRWSVSSRGRVAEPAWINWTGGDSVYSVAIGVGTVYAGGHMRWLDNPLGHGEAGPGAYDVNAIGAIAAETGEAVRTWSTVPSTRGHGKEAMALFAGGLVVGGDGQVVAGEHHAGTALFPAP